MRKSSETRGKVKVEKSEYNIMIPTVGKVLVQSVGDGIWTGSIVYLHLIY